MSDKWNQALDRALDIINDDYNQKEDRDKNNETIKELYQDAFSVSKDGDSPLERKSCKLLFQAVTAMLTRMKPLDFAVHGHQVPEALERIQTGAVAYVMENGGYNAAFRGKDGLAINMLLYGNSFLYYGANPDDDKEVAPIKFTVVPNSSVYVDNYASAIRGAAHGKNATRAAVVFEYDVEHAKRMYPELEDKEVYGDVVDTHVDRTRESKFQEFDRDEKEIVQIAHYYDIGTEEYVCIAGRQKIKLDYKSGEDYPYIKDGMPYIPLSQFSCFYGAEGFYDEGLGSIFYDMVLELRKLTNMQLLHIEDQIAPVTFLTVPNGEVKRTLKSYKYALKLREKGLRPLATLGYDETNPNGSNLNMQTLQAPNNTQAWQIIDQYFERSIKRSGVNLDGIDRGTNVTARQVLAEEESSNAVIKQIMENNATETKHIVEVTISMMKAYIDKDNDTPVDFTTTINLEEIGMKGEKVTLGEVAEDLDVNTYFVRVNSRTGAIPSQAMLRAKYEALLPALAPEDPNRSAVVKSLFELSDLDYDVANPIANNMQQPMGQPGQMPPNPTERQAPTLDNTQNIIPA